tara:strand:+ start:258 stop:641 length:384 start_codon:yes stop_codon:yes gene_type:complete
MIKTISLPPYLYEKAKDIPNFSGWVQDRLEEEGSIVHTAAHRPIVELGICNGVRKPTCAECYPHGAPTRDEWLFFRAEEDPSIESLQETIITRLEGFVDLSKAHREVKPKPTFLKRLKNAYITFKES